MPIENVKLILSPPEKSEDPYYARPFLYDINTELARLGIPREGRPRRIGQRLYFYFAGHGFGSAFDDVGMLMANAARDLTDNIGLRPFRRFFRTALMFNEIVFILDCCRDQKGGIDTIAPFSQVLHVLEHKRQVTGVTDCVVMGAVYGAKALQPFDPLTQRRRGLLTQALLEALRDGAAADPNGRVTIGGLKDYILWRVPQISPKTRRKKQQPEVRTDPDEPQLVLATVPVERRPTVRVRIVARRRIGGELVVLDNTTNEVCGRRPANEVTNNQPPWELDLPRNSEYKIEHTGGLKRENFNLKEKPFPPAVYVHRFPST